MTPTPEQIQSTTIYQDLVKRTPFLCNILVQKHIREQIGIYLYQLQTFGKDYLNDKSNASCREVKIAIELFGKVEGNCKLANPQSQKN